MNFVLSALPSQSRWPLVTMTDASGLPILCSSQEALESFNKGLLALVTLSESSVPWFKRAVELDPTCSMANSMMVDFAVSSKKKLKVLGIYNSF